MLIILNDHHINSTNYFCKVILQATLKIIATLFTILSWEEEDVNREKHGQVSEEAVTETRVLFIKTTSLKSSKLCLKRQALFFKIDVVSMNRTLSDCSILL